jgi:hypothetical protein
MAESATEAPNPARSLRRPGGGIYRMQVCEFLQGGCLALRRGLTNRSVTKLKVLRAGVRGQGFAEVAGEAGHRNIVHRTRQSGGGLLPRELQRKATRRRLE